MRFLTVLHLLLLALPALIILGCHSDANGSGGDGGDDPGNTENRSDTTADADLTHETVVALQPLLPADVPNVVLELRNREQNSVEARFLQPATVGDDPWSAWHSGAAAVSRIQATAQDGIVLTLLSTDPDAPATMLSYATTSFARYVRNVAAVQWLWPRSDGTFVRLPLPTDRTPNEVPPSLRLETAPEGQPQMSLERIAESDANQWILRTSDRGEPLTTTGGAAQAAALLERALSESDATSLGARLRVDIAGESAGEFATLIEAVHSASPNTELQVKAPSLAEIERFSDIDAATAEAAPMVGGRGEDLFFYSHPLNLSHE